MSTKIKDNNVVFDTLFSVALGGASLAGVSHARACFPSPRAGVPSPGWCLQFGFDEISS